MGIELKINYPLYYPPRNLQKSSEFYTLDKSALQRLGSDLCYFEILIVDILPVSGYTEIIGLYPLQCAKQSKVRKEMRTWISGTAKKYLSTTAA